MINVMAVVLLLIGLAERKRFRAAEASGAPPPERTYRNYFIAAAVLFCIFVVYAVSQIGLEDGLVSCLEDFGHAMLLETVCGAVMALLLAAVWFVAKIRSDRISRIVLALWLAAWTAGAGWIVWDLVKYVREDVPLKRRNLLSCRKVIEAGKREELKKFLRETDGGECRFWNAAFEAKFPEAGGGR